MFEDSGGYNVDFWGRGIILFTTGFLLVPNNHAVRWSSLVEKLQLRIKKPKYMWPHLLVFVPLCDSLPGVWAGQGICFCPTECGRVEERLYRDYKSSTIPASRLSLLPSGLYSNRAMYHIRNMGRMASQPQPARSWDFQFLQRLNPTKSYACLKEILPSRTFRQRPALADASPETLRQRTWSTMSRSPDLQREWVTKVCAHWILEGSVTAVGTNTPI